MPRNFLTTAILALLATLALALATAACGGDDDPDVVVIGPDDPVRGPHAASRSTESHRALASSWPSATSDAVHGHEVELGPVVDSHVRHRTEDARARMRIARRTAGARRRRHVVLGVVGDRVPVHQRRRDSSWSRRRPTPRPSSPRTCAATPAPNNHPGYLPGRQQRPLPGRRRSRVSPTMNSACAVRLALHDGDPYTSALARAFREEFRARGGRVPALGTHGEGSDRHERSPSREFAGAAPDSIFFPLFDDGGRPLHPAGAGVQSDWKDVTYITADAAVHFRVPRRARDGGTSTSPRSAAARLEQLQRRDRQDRTDEALEAYAAALPRVGAGRRLFWMHAYDATTLLLAAIERAAVRDDGNFFTRFLGIDERGHAARRPRRATGGRCSEQYPATKVRASRASPARSACDEFGDCGSGVQAVYHHTDPTVTDPGDLPVVYRFEP